jgi:hypothetical protein
LSCKLMRRWLRREIQRRAAQNPALLSALVVLSHRLDHRGTC